MNPTAENPPGSVMMLSGDLLFCSRVKATAERAGLTFRMGGKMPSEDTDSITYVILDLSTRSGLTKDIVGICREHCPNAKLIAYGPHVQVDKLREAEVAGIKTIMSNGQFSNQMKSIFDS